jgi:hypothetical protein
MAINTEPFEIGLISSDFEAYFRNCKKDREEMKCPGG